MPDRYTSITADDSEEVILLKEWMQWWNIDPDAPAKLPNSLHTKTAVFLAEYYHKNRTP